MGALRLAIGPLIALVACPAAAQDLGRWEPLIAEASARFDIPVRWIERVISVESGGRTELGGRAIRSPKGAIGLMQLMPQTWAEMRAQLGLGSDPDDPRDNILAGTFYLRLMYDRFGYPGLFAAYNAGPARYAQSLTGRVLPAETRTYLARVAGRGAAKVSPEPPAGVFAIQKPNIAAAGHLPRRQADPLFAILPR